MRILIVEDDALLGDGLASGLRGVLAGGAYDAGVLGVHGAGWDSTKDTGVPRQRGATVGAAP